MSVHMIVGVTIGMEKIIQSLQKRGAGTIFVMDENHEGPPVDRNGITYYSTNDAIQFCKEYPYVTFHFYRSKLPVMNLNRYEF